MAGTLEIDVELEGKASFLAKNAQGAELRVDGPTELGGTGKSLRPMEAVLAALASCSGIDVVEILRKQRQPLEGLSIKVSGTRADSVPAVFTRIEIAYTAKGAVAPEKLRQAVDLSMDKYCSVARMLQPGVEIVALTGVA
jgi:putative redox protein